MVRAPCCEKMGLKKGPWTPEEDHILIAYIQLHGHPNWRALPKKAGLSRCGKSCRLRWINYLRPDIKRGNFSTEEEETIIKLHEALGNKWSAIAAKLPGRTDNEIKNVWHTHLKKRLEQYQKPDTKKSKTKSKSKVKCDSSDRVITSQSESGSSAETTDHHPEKTMQTPTSPQSSSSEVSSIYTTDITTFNCPDQNLDYINAENMVDSWENFPEIDESFWSDPAMSSDDSSAMAAAVPLSFEEVYDEFQSQAIPCSSTTSVDHTMEPINNEYSQNLDDAMDFWYDLFIEAGGEQELIAEF